MLFIYHIWMLRLRSPAFTDRLKCICTVDVDESKKGGRGEEGRDRIRAVWWYTIWLEDKFIPMHFSETLRFARNYVWNIRPACMLLQVPLGTHQKRKGKKPTPTDNPHQIILYVTASVHLHHTICSSYRLSLDQMASLHFTNVIIKRIHTGYFVF